MKTIINWNYGNPQGLKDKDLYWIIAGLNNVEWFPQICTWNEKRFAWYIPQTGSFIENECVKYYCLYEDIHSIKEEHND